MNDPIAELIEHIQDNPTIRQASGDLRASFLNNVGEVFETYGFATTRLFLLDKSVRRDLENQAKAVLEALKCMEKYDSIKRNRAIGRLLIKTLNQHTHPRTDRKGV